VQDEIAEKVAMALDVVLDEKQLERMRSTGLQNPEAFIAFQKGRQLHSSAHELDSDEMSAGLKLANIEFSKTIELEPEATEAHFAMADYYVHFVLDHVGQVPDDEIAAAVESAKANMRRAMETATSEGQRFDVSLEYTLIAKEWRRTAELYEDALQSGQCLEPSWWALIGPLSQTVDGAIAMWERSMECDPLDFYNWSNLTALLTHKGDYAAAIDMATRGLQTVPHRQTASMLVGAFLAAGQFEEAQGASERYIEDMEQRRVNEMVNMAAQGKADEARSFLDTIIAESGDDAIWLGLYSIVGDRESANQTAAELDADPLGFLVLGDVATSCLCGAPFDLEMTPNFARFIEEADLMWPPRSPVEWPLKDW